MKRSEANQKVASILLKIAKQVAYGSGGMGNVFSDIIKLLRFG